MGTDASRIERNMKESIGNNGNFNKNDGNILNSIAVSPPPN